MIRVVWKVEPSDCAKPQLIMEWREESGPAVQPPKRQGFGHTVIVEMPEHLLDANVSLNYPATGLVWQLSVPLERVAAH